MGDSPMPPDPFSAPQGDWAPMAAGLAGFYAALIAAGMPDRHALHLTGICLTTMLTNALGRQQQQPG
jgi:hypothetical protein